MRVLWVYAVLSLLVVTTNRGDAAAKTHRGKPAGYRIATATAPMDASNRVESPTRERRAQASTAKLAPPPARFLVFEARRDWAVHQHAPSSLTPGAAALDLRGARAPPIA